MNQVSGTCKLVLQSLQILGYKVTMVNQFTMVMKSQVERPHKGKAHL